MAGEIQHSLIPLVNNHKHYRWIVEDEIEKNTIVPLSNDEDKIMLVKDSNKEYRLTNISPIQWQRVSANPEELSQGLEQKVDKVIGKGLSTEDYTTVEKDKLGLIEEEATKNATDAFLLDRLNHTGEQNISTVTGLQVELDSKVDKVVGKGLSTEDFTSDEKSKLNLIEEEATKNASDAELRDRATHTGEQGISTVTGLQEELDGKASNHVLAEYALSSSLSTVAATGSYNDLLNKPDLSVLEEVLVFPTENDFPASGESQKVYIAENTGYMFRWSGSEYVQLTDQTAIWGNISGTLSNQTDLQNALDAKANDADISAVGKSNNYNDLSNIPSKFAPEAHTHVEADITNLDKYSTSEIDGLLNGKVDKVVGKQLSTEDYTTTEKTKLVGVETGAQVNVPTNLGITAGTTDGPVVTSSTGNNATLPTASGTASGVVTTGAQTWAGVKTFSSNPRSSATQGTDAADLTRKDYVDGSLATKVDKVTGKQLSTEDYTTAEKSKLANIQTEATKNATDAQLRDRSTHTGTQPISTVSGLQTSLDSKLEDAPNDGKSYVRKNGVWVALTWGAE